MVYSHPMAEISLTIYDFKCPFKVSKGSSWTNGELCSFHDASRTLRLVGSEAPARLVRTRDLRAPRRQDLAKQLMG